jgi:WD40 repeat protein
MQKPSWNTATWLAAIVSLTVLWAGSVCAATEPVGSWSPPINLGPIVNSPSAEIQVAITHNGLSLYIVSDRPGGYGANDIWVSRRASQSAPWGEPQNLGPIINSTGNDSGPNFFLDDHWMFFASPRSGTLGGSDIWVSYRLDVTDDFGWQQPVNLGPNVNTSAPEADPFYFVNPITGQATLYFTAFNRPGGLGDWDVFQSTRNEDGSFNPAVLNKELSTPYRDTRMTITTDGLEMILSSDRPENVGGIDLWVSTRNNPTGPWSPPTNLGLTIDSAEDDRGPSGSNDGLLLFFSSNRSSGAGNDDIYVSVRLSKSER